VTALALVALALALFEHDDLIAAFIFEDFRGDFGTGEGGGADLEGGAFTGRKDFGDLDDGTGLGVRETVYEKDVAFGDGELLTLSFDGRFHGNKGEITESVVGSCKDNLAVRVKTLGVIYADSEAFRYGDGFEQGRTLVNRLLKFAFGHAIGYYASTGLDVDPAVF